MGYPQAQDRAQRADRATGMAYIFPVSGPSPTACSSERKPLNQTCDLSILSAIASLLLPPTPSWRANSRASPSLLWY